MYVRSRLARLDAGTGRGTSLGLGVGKPGTGQRERGRNRTFIDMTVEVRTMGGIEKNSILFHEGACTRRRRVRAPT